MIRDPFAAPEEIGLGSDQLAFLVLKARAFDEETSGTDPDDGSNAADDRAVDALESSPDNTNARELRGAILGMNEEAQIALVALVWVGRGDFDADEWDDALAAARDARRDGPTAGYLLGIPLLGDLIEEGADKLGLNLTEDEQIGMHHPITEEPAEDDRD